jgi:hypothetical protein
MAPLPKTFSTTNKVDFTGKTAAQAEKLRKALYKHPDIHPALSNIVGSKVSATTTFVEWIWGQWNKYASRPGDLKSQGIEEFTHKFKIRKL